MKNLDSTIEELYNKRIDFIKIRNNELERNYFLQQSNEYPLSNVLNGKSFLDNYLLFKESLKRNDIVDSERVFCILEELFLFTNDYMYATKDDINSYNSISIKDYIYPKMVEDIKERYNDVSIMPENPMYQQNIFNIKHIIFVYTELQSLLDLLYRHNFILLDKWEELFDGDEDELLEKIEDSDTIIKNYLMNLINYKCDIMEEIFKGISDEDIRNEYLNKIKQVRDKKLDSTDDHSSNSLPVNYFLTHTMKDFIDEGYPKKRDNKKLMKEKK